MSTLFLVLQFIFAVVLTIAILLQKSSSIGLGAYSGSNESLFGAKGPAGFLAKFTFFVGFLFILNTLALGYTYNQSLRNSVVQSSEFESIVPAASIDTNASSAPAAPMAPMAPVAPLTPAMMPDTNASTMQTPDANSTPMMAQTPAKSETNTTKE